MRTSERLAPIAILVCAVLLIVASIATLRRVASDTGTQINANTWRITAGYAANDTRVSVLETNLVNFQTAHPELEIVYTTTTPPDWSGWSYCLITVKPKPAEAAQ